MSALRPAPVIWVIAAMVIAAACGGGTAGGGTATTDVPSSTTTASVITTSAPTTTTVVATTATPGTTAVTTTGAGGGDPLLDRGRTIWNETYLLEGCQKCHGLDARGTADGPDIRGVGRGKIVDALVDVEEMEWETELTSTEIDAVFAYLSYLSTLP